MSYDEQCRHRKSIVQVGLTNSQQEIDYDPATELYPDTGEKTWEEIGEYFFVTHSRARQIADRALMKLRLFPGVEILKPFWDD